MNSKKEIIEFINAQSNNALNTLNTSYSNINVSKEVWWFNVATHRGQGYLGVPSKRICK